MQQLDTYLMFDGQCEEAFKFYAEVLGGKIEGMMTFEGSPAAGSVPAGAEWGKRILHTRLTAGKSALMGSDCPPGHFQKPQGFAVSIGVKDVAEADRIFNALADRGNVTMPIAETFWSPRFGMVTDRFGIPWMVNAEGAAQAASS
jgi:PhnB protein